jgi:glucosamine--fructose-6-phosphate aminotransferase (isomerizing)
LCGIVGFTGAGGAVAAVLDGLKRLEYRGYDSAGVAAITPDGLNVIRAAGKVAALREKVEREAEGLNDAASAAIGHTRWATHGAPTERNAHPHVDASRRVALVHNGIVENYAELRSDLSSRGVEFASDTDTETVVQLIGLGLEGGMLEAVRGAVGRIAGTYAFAAVSVTEPGVIYAARRESPLVIGLADGGPSGEATLVASDPVPILPYTKRVVFLNDGEIARLEPGRVTIWDAAGAERKPEIHVIEWDAERVEKGGYDHFMLKEIFEQPWAIRQTLEGRIDLAREAVTLEGTAPSAEDLRSVERVVIVACGTAWHAGLIGRNMIERTARVPVQVDYASEFRYRDPIVDARTLVIAVSQSGETADTLGALREAKSRGARTLGIVNVPGSTVARESDFLLPTRAGPEIGVASTKAFTGQIVALYLLAIELGRVRGTLPAGEMRRRVRDVLGVADGVQALLTSRAEDIKRIALKYVDARNALYLGRGTGFPLALEGALKLKEISYIHAEGYHAAEMKHGPIALIDEEMPVVVLALRGRRYAKILSNIEEVRSRGGRVIALASDGDDGIRSLAEDVIYLRAESGIMNSVLAAVPLQLFAYHIASARGLDVDQPRNLAKSVTVE